jgi:mono/diheme cytochrome c family protein
VTIQQVVRDQIELAEPPMPANLVTGRDADDVAAYVAHRRRQAGRREELDQRQGHLRANCGSCHTLKDAGTKGRSGRTSTS